MLKKNGPGPVRVIHVNTHVMRRNAKKVLSGKGPGELQPPLTSKLKSGGRSVTGNTMVIRYRGIEVARVVYRPFDRLKSGAVAWVETEYEVEVVPDPKPEPSVEAPLQSAQGTDQLLALLLRMHGPRIEQLLNTARADTASAEVSSATS